MANIEHYVVTGQNYPVWLNNAARNGLAKTITDIDGNFSHIIVTTPSGKKTANVGDVIVKTHSGCSVLTGEQARKYKLLPKNSKVK